MRCMGDELHVIPSELQGAGAGWHMEAAELHAVPPSLDPAGAWPTMVAAAAMTGVAQAATADLHSRITTTAEATQAAGTAYEVGDSNAADTIKNVITTVTDTVRKNT
ncbi:hypothetical protein AWC32_05745 [Mycobacterium xenopi]|uniref:Uncharacterized protein n=2 Tax=Mycobacterium xenopi TaxID=1789 RepID=A0AAD1H050_MYCXE|nr:hypothetical protein AWC32_05745 [Mycobacterium xenopi]BBU21825.1 hypothetical protein MYXE_16140 [Mycobacterium xenopi]SPX93636.1 Uncharacterised protein [Mycobacterium xenopi]